jgi:hypothetical protein
MTNKYMKNYSITLVISKMQSTATRRHLYTLAMGKTKKTYNIKE